MSAYNDDFLSFLIVNAVGIAGVAVSLFDFFLVQRRSLFELSLIGVVVFLAGEALIFSGRRALGEYFTTRIRIAGGQKLIQSGPHRYVRHPIYLGILLQYLAAPIAWRSSYGALVMLAIIPLVLRRIGLEERAMESHFGAEYEAYSKRTKKLIPLVYRVGAHQRLPWGQRELKRTGRVPNRAKGALREAVPLQGVLPLTQG